MIKLISINVLRKPNVIYDLMGNDMIQILKI